MVHESPQQSNNESKSSLFVFLVHLIESVNVSAKMLKGNKDSFFFKSIDQSQIRSSRLSAQDKELLRVLPHKTQVLVPVYTPQQEKRLSVSFRGGIFLVSSCSHHFQYQLQTAMKA